MSDSHTMFYQASEWLACISWSLRVWGGYQISANVTCECMWCSVGQYAVYYAVMHILCCSLIHFRSDVIGFLCSIQVVTTHIATNPEDDILASLYEDFRAISFEINFAIGTIRKDNGFEVSTINNEFFVSSPVYALNVAPHFIKLGRKACESRTLSMATVKFQWFCNCICIVSWTGLQWSFSYTSFNAGEHLCFLVIVDRNLTNDSRTGAATHPADIPKSCSPVPGICRVSTSIYEYLRVSTSIYEYLRPVYFSSCCSEWCELVRLKRTRRLLTAPLSVSPLPPHLYSMRCVYHAPYFLFVAYSWISRRSTRFCHYSEDLWVLMASSDAAAGEEDNVSWFLGKGMCHVIYYWKKCHEQERRLNLDEVPSPPKRQKLTRQCSEEVKRLIYSNPCQSAWDTLCNTLL